MRRLLTLLMCVFCALTITAQTYHFESIVHELPQYTIVQVESGDNDVLKSVMLVNPNTELTPQDHIAAIDSILSRSDAVPLGEWSEENGAYKRIYNYEHNMMVIIIDRDEDTNAYYISIHECAEIYK